MSAALHAVLREVYEGGGSHNYDALRELQARALIYATTDDRCPYRLTESGYQELADKS
jgi:hypothetical protein